jgi:hypothetical protein
MKIMLVVEKDETQNALEQHLHPRGFEFITYKNPIKAMDNIDEVSPDIVLFSGEDFPRHWKPFLRLLRNSFAKEQTVFILLIGEVFPFEEAAKAAELKANGILGEDFQDKRKMLHIEGLLSRYKMIRDNRKGPRYIPDDYDELEFIFTHPETLKLITGVIDDVSTEGVGFTPDSPHLSSDLEDGSEIPFCSLRIADEIISVTCSVIRNSKNLALEFVNLPEEDKVKLADYIENRPARELQHLQESTAPQISTES